MTTPALSEHVRGRGRHYRNPVTGDLVPSVTNVIGTLSKGEALTRWSAKMVAETAYRMRNALPNMEETEAVDLLKSSPWNRSKRASERGTDIHAYLEARLNGLAPEPLSDDAMPYKDAADDWFEYAGASLEEVQTEVTMFHPGYAGTTDLIAKQDGKWVVADFKTSKQIWDEAALQLSALAACLTLADGSLVPWRDEHGGLVDQPELLVVRIGVDGWQEKVVADPHGSLVAFFGLLDAWHWKHQKAYL
jgi:hypothetical protein